MNKILLVLNRSILKHRLTSTGKRYFSVKQDENETKMFDKILVANRGEIAIRIMKTCRKLGIPSVAVYSEADENSLFLKYADESVFIGPGPSAQSYLCMEAILEACKKAGASAVHPGYGFLSEKPEFAELLIKNGITFIGPPPAAMRLMSDKLQSKESGIKAKVNVVPGNHAVIEDVEKAVTVANEIGYPVMVKAVGGGGGRGMRVANNEIEVRENFQICFQEALSSFSDSRLFIEKFIERPRHIEFQILGDQLGNVIHLNERECSIQRRNQKIIEEAPSHFLTMEIRQEMGAQAVRLAKSTNYQSAGTIEFLVDKNRNFYFLEMNTRLQVEHPITEMITGIDLVEQMIRVAAGQKLTITQENVPLHGWSMEVRINAENPLISFGVPAVGRIQRYIEPSYHKNVRIDSGITEGSEITPYYDSLISKLIVHNMNREMMIKTMKRALDDYVIRGVKSNIALLRDIMDDPNFHAGDISTKYLMEKYPDGFKGKVLDHKTTNHVIICGFLSFLSKELSYGDKNYKSAMFYDQKYYVEIGKKYVGVKLIECDKKIKLMIEHEEHVVTILSSTQDNNVKNVIVDIYHLSYQNILRKGNLFTIQLYGTIFSVSVMSENEKNMSEYIPMLEENTTENIIKASMFGTIVNISVNEGDTVEKDFDLGVIEAMKCQNPIRAPTRGKIKKIFTAIGEKVEEGKILIEIQPI